MSSFLEVWVFVVVVVVVICVGFSSVFKAVSGLLRDAVLVILSAILLPIKWSVASAIFELLFLKPI